MLGWWSGNTPLESVITGQSNPPTGMLMTLAIEAEYENVLIADWGTDMQIINEEADELIIDSSAFNEVGMKEIHVVDDDENPVGTWLFGDDSNTVRTFRLLRRAAAPSDDFNAKLIVDYADEAGENLTVTVADSTIFSTKRPILTIPYDFAGAITTAPDSSTQAAVAANGQISFSVSMSGTYTISRIGDFSVIFDPNNGERPVTKTVLSGENVMPPTDPIRWVVRFPWLDREWG